MLSRAAIQRKCAFTYRNAVSRKNLTDARAVNANDVRTALDIGAAFGGVTGIVPPRRMMVTCMWGVSDPCGPGLGRRRGHPMGVAHAPTPLSLAAIAPGRDTGGTERRRVVVTQFADCQEHGGCTLAASSDRARQRSARTALASGERCSRVSVPPPCSPPLES